MVSAAGVAAGPAVARVPRLRRDRRHRGLGLGYICPLVSTLVKWFPDRPGMAMGWPSWDSAAAHLIGALLSPRWELMGRLQVVHVGGWVKEAFQVILACVYFAFMMFGTFLVRVPPRQPARSPARVGCQAPSAAARSSTRESVLVVDVAPGRPRSSGSCGECSCLQRHGGDRHPRPGLAHVPGHVRRGHGGRRRRPSRGCSASLQHGRAVLLVVALRPDRSARRFTCVYFFSRRVAALCARPPEPEAPERDLLRADHRRHHPLDVRRGLRDDPRLPPGPVRHHAPRCDRWPADHRPGRWPRSSARSSSTRSPTRRTPPGSPAPTSTRSRSTSWSGCCWSASSPTC